MDPLALAVSSDPGSAGVTLETVRILHEKGIRTSLGVSNISFGLPVRELINSTFLTMAMARGLDLPILNPNNRAMMDAVSAAAVLLGHDKSAERFIAAHAGQAAAPAAAPSGSWRFSARNGKRRSKETQK